MNVNRRYRVFLPVLLMYAAPLAMAQQRLVEPQSIPYGLDQHGDQVPMSTAQYYYYSHIVQTAKLDPGSEFLSGIRARLQLDEQQYQTMLDYMRDTLDKGHGYAIDLEREMCVRRSTITTVSQLAAIRLDDEQRVEARRADLVNGLARILEGKARQTFEAMVREYRQDLTVHRLDYAKMVADHLDSSDTGLDRECAGFGPGI